MIIHPSQVINTYPESTEDTYSYQKQKKLDIFNTKNLPTILFVIYFILFAPIIVESLSYLQNIKLEFFYQNKYKLIYLSEYLGRNSLLVKVFTLKAVICINLTINIFHNNSHSSNINQTTGSRSRASR